MLRVLIVDDTATTRLLLRTAIDGSGDMQVVGEATDGHEAVSMARRLRPDVILMDITMPNMNGLDATREIMSDTPTPIVMISASVEGRETEVAFSAMKLGALALLSKPVGPADPLHQQQIAHILKTVRTMAGVRVIHHRRSPVHERQYPSTPPIQPRQAELVVIGASTGGPAALAEVLRGLPPTFDLPVVIAQHIAPEFVPSLAQWLDSLTPLSVRSAEGEPGPQRGVVHIAPANVNLTFDPRGRYALDTTVTPYTPSCDVLFNGAATVFGSRAVGVILTGMGADGAQGLKHMALAGAMTIAQDEASSAVFGMPQEAITRGAVRRIARLDEIAGLLAAFQQDNPVTQ